MNAQSAHGKRTASSRTDYAGVLSSVMRVVFFWVFRAADGAAFRFFDFHHVIVIRYLVIVD